MPAPKPKDETPAPAAPPAPAPAAQAPETPQEQETQQEEPRYVDEQQAPAYTDEELEYAKGLIETMTPESAAEMVRYTTALERSNYEMAGRSGDFPEARVIVFTELWSSQGNKYHITQRGDSVREVLDKMIEGFRYARDQYLMTPTPGESFKNGSNGGAPKAQSGGGTQQGANVAEAGTDTLNRIVVTSDKAQFFVGQFKYPFSDKRGAEIVSGLFDTALGWTPQHFGRVAEYTPNDWKETLVVDWAKELSKNGKYYYNVKRIHRPGA